ncbi:hypothetical protein [Streptomyces pseudovenezuelae]|uniref:Protein kinase domain-containing protein n=1 Tax=Streptomyces pseudovenezuelae TaxID=67350 RepID=A0ABT6LEW2_9ACTN|nr:hypothetical protein [Streptomyces pseudovenezuelae]MDH6214324.1 hypothetical protein [Streptomyces pseudovenezuelae]
MSDCCDAGVSASTGVRMELSGLTLAGRYQLKELLGRGGMGEVWLGCDASVLRRDVAVKVMPSTAGAAAEPWPAVDRTG